MRLTDKQITDIKEYLNRSIKVATSSLIPKLSRHGLDMIDTIKALQQENEQLRAQAARMREALKQIALYDEYMTGAHEVAKQALSDTPADYHNPADVELLRKARKALHKGISELKVHCKYFDQTPEEDACIEMHEAVVEIDKAIGGKEDE